MISNKIGEKTLSISLFITPCICFFFSILPIFVKIPIHEETYGNLMGVLESNIYENCVLANVVLSLPYTIEYLLDTISFFWCLHKRPTSLWLPSSKTFLIVSLLFPNLANLIFSIPLRDVDLFCAIFTFRIILILYGFATHIVSVGGSYFRTKSYIFGNALLFIGVCLIGLGVYLSPTSFFYKWVGGSLFCIGGIILSYIFTKWIISLSSIGYKNLPLPQWNCFWDIIIFWLLGIILVIITLISKKFEFSYCIIVTYAEGIVALCLIIIDNRYTRLEILNLRDVSYILMFLSIIKFCLYNTYYYMYIIYQYLLVYIYIYRKC